MVDKNLRKSLHSGSLSSHNKIRVVSVILGLFALAFLSVFAVRYEANAAGENNNNSTESNQDGTNPGYNNVDVRAGVWNNGQAAFWDLHILDHYRYLGPEERVRGYRPEQPIKFSHVTHVQKNQMDCQYCHWSVAKAAYAAIPEVQTCMGCHTLVRGTTTEQQTEIAKVDKAWNANKPIEWVKVHVMPSHLHFNHKRHIKAGVTCQSCHGQVPKMEVVERVSTMRMGWCIDCHRQKGASIDCYTCHY